MQVATGNSTNKLTFQICTDSLAASYIFYWGTGRLNPLFSDRSISHTLCRLYLLPKTLNLSTLLHLVTICSICYYTHKPSWHSKITSLVTCKVKSLHTLNIKWHVLCMWNWTQFWSMCLEDTTNLKCVGNAVTTVYPLNIMPDKIL